MPDETSEASPAEVVTDAEIEMISYYPPRGTWDFTDPQRIGLGFLIWLNIIMRTVGSLVVTGQLTL